MGIKEMKGLKKQIIRLFLFSATLLMLSGCVQPVMSCAGIKTYPRCAKFCTHDAVATCESSVQANIRSINDMHQRNMRNIYKKNDNDY
jgi:hypothetical protein